MRVVRKKRPVPGIAALSLALAVACGLPGCMDSAGSKADAPPGGDAYVKIRVAVPRVNSAAKGALISLSRMIVMLTSNGSPADTIRDTLTTGTSPALSSVSTANQTVSKGYSLKPLRVWKVTVKVMDSLGYVTHLDSASTGSPLQVADTATISLNLSARYSMYEADFVTLPDSLSSLTGSAKQVLRINRLVLKIDGAAVRDSTAVPWFTALATHKLNYDYVSVGTGSWKVAASGTPKKLYAVQFPTADTGYAVGDTTVLKTVDGGATWNPVAGAIPRTMRYLSFTSGSTGVIGGDSATSGRTTDGGATWTFQKLSNFTSAAAPVLLIGDSGYSFSNSPTLTGSTTYRWTTNGGATWNISGGAPNNIYAVSCFGTGTCWAAGYGGVIRKAPVFADNFGTLQNNSGPSLYGVAFTDANTGVAVGDSGRILKTTDGGATWAVKTSGTPQNLRAVYFLDASIGFASGAAGVLLSTNDGGDTWSAQTSNTSQSLNGLAFAGATGFAAGDAGTLIRLSDIHLVQLLMYGPSGASPLFSGSKFINAAAGVDRTANLTLSWVGSTTDSASVSAVIGKVGKVIVTGTATGTGALP